VRAGRSPFFLSAKRRPPVGDVVREARRWLSRGEAASTALLSTTTISYPAPTHQQSTPPQLDTMNQQQQQQMPDWQAGRRMDVGDQVRFNNEPYVVQQAHQSRPSPSHLAFQFISRRSSPPSADP
jgi:hypothetical protein